MGKLERITIDLPEELVSAVRAAVSSGDYPTMSEAVSDALREWQAEQAAPPGVPSPRSREELLEMIAEGEKGPFLDGPTSLSELRAKYRQESE